MVPPVVRDKIFENIAVEPKTSIQWFPPIPKWNAWLFARIEEGPIAQVTQLLKLFNIFENTELFQLIFKASLEDMSEDLYLMFVDRFKHEKECQRVGINF